MVNKTKNQKSYEKIKIGFILLLMLLASSNLSLFSQTKNVGIGTDNPNASALLDLDVSNNTEFPTKKGLLIPRVTEAQKNAISDPANGLIIYQTDGTLGFYYWSGTAWVKLTTATEANQYLPLAGGSMTGTINMQNNTILNIGNAGTDFTASGGLNLADAVSATRFTSTVPTGTSPFTIASNTLVTNLNADLLDGNEASAFASSSHTHTGVYEPIITAGTASQYWRGDKTWVNFPTSLAPSGAASQDLSGTYPGPTVAKIRGSLVSETAPTNNQILKWNGTAWTPSADENTTYTAGTGLTLTGNEFSANNTTALWNANKLQGKNLSTTSPTDEQVLRWNNTANEWQPTTIASGGTVTSVGLTMPTQFTVSNTPITGSGDIIVNLATQNANIVFAGPTTGEASTPTFRQLVAADIPELSTDKITDGTLPVARGGTGATTLTGMLKGDGTNAFTGITAGSRQLVFWSDANTIAGNDSLKWAEGTFSITGDLQVTGDIDPLSLSMVPLTTAPSEVEGKIYYNQTDHGLKVYNGTSWVTLGSGGGGAELPAGSENQTLRHNGTDWEASDVLMNNGTKIGIGTNNPDSTLHINGSAHFSQSVRILGDLAVDGIIDPKAIVLMPQTSIPSNNQPGTIYYDVNNSQMKIYDGTNWGTIAANIGGNSVVDANLELKGTETAKELRFYEPPDGTDYTAFKAQAQTENITYNLPTTLPTENQLLAVSSVASNTATLEWLTPSIVRAYKTANQTTQTGQWIKITFDDENFDLKNEFSGGTFTASESGYYKVSTRIAYNPTVSPGANAYLTSKINKNGSLFSYGSKSAIKAGTQNLPDNNTTLIEDIIYLSNSDYIEIYFFNNSGASNIHSYVLGGSEETYISIYKIY